RALERAGAQVLEGPVGARVVLFGDTLDFEARSPFFRAAGRLQHLAFPATRRDGVLYLPRQLFVSWLPERYPSRVSYGDGVLRIAGVPPVAAAAPPPAPTREVSRTRVVVLDAGHGGRDPGKVGPGGIREKDVTLSVVRRLEAELARRGGYEVHLTRTTDTLIALDDRPRMANAWKAGRPLALFVSVHANAHSSPARGFETFFLSEARTEDERRVAEMENEAVRFETETPQANVDDLMLIANGLRNDFYLRASNGLAEVSQRNMAAFHPGPNRGVKQAAFRVLIGAVMPAVLVELAFISNREEAALLASSTFQAKLAWALANAIDEFFDQNEGLWLAGSDR
ncbi:MAG TPA: N-acetylmuramoyl-L-alanine amidase, partial [Longimicrobiales bacterium]|nr:N-acetylmuramoyl-L-alanine amidase [Longimicrobiales bacterium]